MNEHELAEKMKEAFKNKQMTKELYQETLDWCNANTENMDLTNKDQYYLYFISTQYLMKNNQLSSWNENDVNIMMNFMAKNTLNLFNLSKNTSIEMLNREEYNKRYGSFSSAVCLNLENNKYRIEYSPTVKDLLICKNINQKLRGFQILFHEIVHVIQNTTMKKERLNSPETYLMAMETLARREAPDIYKGENYDHLLKENHAEKTGLELAIKNIQQFGPDLYKLYDQEKIENKKKEYDARFYEGEIELYGKNRKGIRQIDKACSKYISKNPDTLKEFPVLQFGFNMDGTKKTLDQLLTRRQEVLEKGNPEDIVNKFFSTLANYKNFVKDTQIGIKEELRYLKDYVAETGTDDEFIFDLIEYRLDNTTLTPKEKENYMQSQRVIAQKVRENKKEQEQREVQEQEKKQEKTKSINDNKIEDAFVPDTQDDIQREKDAETKIMNSLQIITENTINNENIKDINDATKVIADIVDQEKKSKREEIQNENNNDNTRGG